MASNIVLADDYWRMVNEFEGPEEWGVKCEREMTTCPGRMRDDGWLICGGDQVLNRTTLTVNGNNVNHERRRLQRDGEYG